MSNLGKQVETHWTYPLALATQDKRVPLSATTAPYSHELAGVDGILQGGCRPISGFSKIYDLDFWDDANHDYRSVVSDFFPVNFKIGFETYGYGFIYRATRPNSTVADVFFDFYLGACKTWTKGNKVMTGVSATEEMNVTVAGRNTFIFIRGQSPTLLFVNPLDFNAGETSEDGIQLSGSSSEENNVDCMADYELVIEDSPGPGLQPSLSDVIKTYGTRADPSHWFGAKQPSNDRPGVANLILTKELPSSAALVATGTALASGTFDARQLGNRTDDAARTALSSLMGAAFDCSTPQESSDIFYTSEDSLVSVIDSTDEALVLSSAVTFMGSTPGGRRYPSGSIVDRDMYLYDINTITSGNYVDQTEKITGYFRIDRTKVDPDKVVFDLQVLEETSSDGSQGWQTIYGGIHLRLDAGNYDSHITVNTNDLGGQYVTRNAASPYTTVAEDLGPVDNDGTQYYRINVNISSLFSASKWVTGTYKYRWKIRSICGSTSERLQAISKQFDFEVAPYYITFGGDNPLGDNEISSSDDLIFDNLNQLKKGNYSFAYQLFDSKTGRRSSLSEIKSIDETAFDGASNTFNSAFACLDIVWDKNKYDKAMVWRSVDTSAIGLTGIGTLQLEKIIDLEEYKVFDPAMENVDSDEWEHSFFVYGLTDEVLAFQQAYPAGVPVFDENLPYGGSSAFYEGTLFISNIRNSPVSVAGDNNLNDAKRGLGELRWSSLTDFSPELFPASNYFVPGTPTNEIILLSPMGGNLLGFSADRMYFIRKEGGASGAYMRITEVHEGYGVINQECASTIGSSSYFLTPRGLKSVNAVGKLDDVGAFDHLIFNEWQKDLSNVSIAYDSASSCLMILSSDDEEIACLWFNSSRATSIRDATFDQCKEGVWVKDHNDYSSSLIDRAMFLMNPPQNGTTGSTTTKPRIYVLDYKREKTATVGGSSVNRLTTLDGPDETVFTTTGTSSAVTNSDGSFATVTVTGYTVAPSSEWVGAYAYVLSSSDSTKVGKKARIAKTSGGTLTLMGTQLRGLPADSIIGISPVYFRWVGYPLPLQVEGQEFNQQNFHRTRHVDSLSAAFTDVSSPSYLTGYSRFNALLFDNTLSNVKDSSYVLDEEKNNVDSVVDGQSVHWASFGTDSTLDGSYGVISTNPTPGLEIFTPDLDFRLMSVLVSGKLLPVYRTSLS